MSNYACIFQRGFFGTFLIYFINQHEDFSKQEYVANYKHFNDTNLVDQAPVHINMPKHSFYYKPKMHNVERFKGQVELLDWDEWRAQHPSKKIAFKPVPHHYDQFDNEYCDFLQERAWFIVCNFHQGMERAIKRVAKYGSDGFDPEEYVVGRNNEALELARRRGAFLLDMGKLLDCDIRTYGTLCTYLGTKPLDGWQDLVNHHKELIRFDEFE